MAHEHLMIWDIDGTLANNEHRQKHLFAGKKPDWDAFYAGCAGDTPIDEMCKLCRRLSVFYECIFVTGRREECRADTIAWLVQHVGDWCAFAPLYMRPNGDKRPDYEVKSLILDTIYAEHVEPRKPIAFVVDDRKQVVEMWRSRGLLCLQCADGDF